MVAMGRGGGKTPERVVEAIKTAVAELGQNGTSRALGLPLRSIQKYMQGISEPTEATLRKLADYFNVPIAVLRGDFILNSKQNFNTFLDVLYSRGKGEISQQILQELFDEFTSELRRYYSEKQVNEVVAAIMDDLKHKVKNLADDYSIEHITEVIKKLAPKEISELLEIIEHWQSNKSFRKKISQLLVEEKVLSDHQ